MLILQISFLSMCMDIQTEKIANRGAGIFWFAGLGYQIWLRKLSGIWEFAAGAAVPIILLAGLFALRMLGPGDIKLFSALRRRYGGCAHYPVHHLFILIGAVLSAAVILPLQKCRGTSAVFHRVSFTNVSKRKQFILITEREDG